MPNGPAKRAGPFVAPSRSPAGTPLADARADSYTVGIARSPRVPNQEKALMEHPQPPHVTGPGAADAASGHPTTDHLLFPRADIDVFHEEDRTAARRIVGLMMAIFTCGLVGYLLIDFWVRSSAGS